MQYIKIKNIQPVIEAYKEMNAPFTIEGTTFTKKVITKDKIYHYVPISDMLPCEMNLIKSVKKFAESLPANKIPKVNRKKISYIRRNSEYLDMALSFNSRKITLTSELYEIDLNKAFWEFAFRENLISEKIYLQGLNICPIKKTEILPIYNKKGIATNIISKKTRLIALGNLAKRISIINFNGHFFDRPKYKSNNTENIFFKVAQLTDVTMKHLELIAGVNFIFYWCDAIFFAGENTKKNIETFLTDEMNFKYKTVPVKKIEFKTDQIVVTDEKEVRPFMFEAIKGIDVTKLVNSKTEVNNSNFLKDGKKRKRTN